MRIVASNQTQIMPTNKLLSEVIDGLWEKTAPDFQKLSEEVIRKTAEEHAKRLGRTINEREEEARDETAAFFTRLQALVFAAVKAELFEKILMIFSEPSRFEALFFESIIKHGAETKRATASEFQKCLNDMCGKIGCQGDAIDFKYDVENDIEKTTSTIRKIIESKFKLELLFWSAVDGNQLEEASAFLTAIEFSRAKAEPALQREMFLWRFDLAFKMKGAASCKSSLEKMARLKGRYEFEDMRLLLENGIHRLFADTCCKQLQIVPSALGLKEVREKGTQSFFDEHTRLFVTVAASQIALAMWADPEADFHTVAVRVLGEKRLAFLQVNPYVDDIRGGV